uniref:Uncharacterized protein n=1 Tax=Oryza punctata TaxID=4537 RepID=A0A0E0K5A1_ORYPU
MEVYTQAGFWHDQLKSKSPAPQGNTAVRSQRDPSPPRRRYAALPKAAPSRPTRRHPSPCLPLQQPPSLRLHRLCRHRHQIPHPLEDTLVAACGLTGAQALKASKRLQKAPSNLDAALTFLAFLADFCLSKVNIAAAIPRVHFALRNNANLLRRNNIESEVKPNIAFLEHCGLNKLGMPRESAGFKYAVMAVTCISPVRVSAKLDFLKMMPSSILRCLGCSLILTYSEVKLSRSLEFLNAEYIVLRPALLGYSIQKRLMPRYHVMKVLNEKGLLKKDTDFYCLVKIVEERFFKKFLLPYHRSVPGLVQA